jgi:AbrB family looped-hinge helix DNA binding protein
METTKLSSKGQVIIPKAFRTTHNWNAGLELIATEMDDGLLLRPKTPFAETSLNEVAGSLKPAGEAKSDKEIETAMKRAARKAWRDSD